MLNASVCSGCKCSSSERGKKKGGNVSGKSKTIIHYAFIGLRIRVPHLSCYKYQPLQLKDETVLFWHPIYEELGHLWHFLWDALVANFFCNFTLLQVAEERSNGCAWICKPKAISDEDC